MGTTSRPARRSSRFRLLRGNRGPEPPRRAGTDTLWTVVEVAEFLQVSRSWVYRAAEGNLLPHMRIGALLRFSPAEIREYAKQSR